MGWTEYCFKCQYRFHPHEETLRCADCGEYMCDVCRKKLKYKCDCEDKKECACIENGHVDILCKSCKHIRNERLKKEKRYNKMVEENKKLRGEIRRLKKNLI